jgi:hypothetical protein
MTDTFQTDDFIRKPIAEKIIKLLVADSGLAPLVIDGTWGSGKTVFCQKLAHLAKESHPEIHWLYVDCFRFDDTDDPMTMLITSISSLIKDETAKKDFLKHSIPIAKVLSKVALKSLVSITLKANTDEIGQEIENALTDGGDDLIDLGIKKVFEDFEKVEEKLALFKKSLNTITKDKKMVLILDELDRCKPTFALSIFEKIKHVFDVEGVQFVITTNLRQLGSMVRKQYGHEMDAELYLNKFYRFSITLSETHTTNAITHRQNSYVLFRKNAIADQHLKSSFENIEGAISAIFEHLFEKDRISLRDAEKFYLKIKILKAVDAKNSIDDNSPWPYACIILLGIYIQTFKPDFTTKLLSDNVKPEDINFFFGLTPEALNEYNYTDPQLTFYAIFLSYICTDFYKQQVTEDNQRVVDADIRKIFSRGFTPNRDRKLSMLKDVIRDLQFL